MDGTESESWPNFPTSDTKQFGLLCEDRKKWKWEFIQIDEWKKKEKSPHFRDKN